LPRAFDIPEAEKPVIVFNEVSKSFKIKHTQSFKEAVIAALKRKELSSNFNAVENVSFEVLKGQSVALMGRNGSGKSTTLKLLSGVMQPDNGWVRTRGRVAGLLEVGAGFHPDLTGRENVYLNAAILGMNKDEIDDRFHTILEFSEIGEFIDTEVKRYSSGMYARLGFSVAVHTEPETLLVDEVLSVGDAQFREKCDIRMLELQEQGITMFIVSHSFGQVKRLCERGIVLERGKVAFDGAIEEAVDFLDYGGSPASHKQISYSVSGGIKRVHDRARNFYGRPTGPETYIEENGSGWFQHFERGYITYSTELKKGCGLLQGELLESYLLSGGAAGPWGFLSEDASSPVEGRIDSMDFQNGHVAFSDATGYRISH
jgi:ABC-2 type transport system ATP-binding protein